MEKILEILKELKVNEYRLVDETVYAKEWFFIKKKLDMSRAKKVKYFYLTVYQTIYENTERFKGSSSCKLNAQEDEQTLRESIKELIKSASLVKNPYFELPCPEEAAANTVSPIGNIHEVFEMMKDFHETEDISLNSFELFENLTEVHIVNSKGIDVTYSYPGHELELVINAKDNTHEIEIYQDLRFGQPNVAELKRQIGESRRQALDRREAVALEKIPERIIISKENVLEIFRYYLMQLSTDRLYRKYSTVQIGDYLGPAGFHLEGMPYLENSSKNKAYDEDGRLCKPVVLVDQGQVIHVWGSHVFSDYMHIPETTMINNYKVAPGTLSVEEMRSQPYLEVVQFSSFSCQMITGDFSGEIRLGYYFDGEKTIAVSGGSISGNVKTNEADMVLSKELEKYDGAVVPLAIMLSHVNVAL